MIPKSWQIALKNVVRDPKVLLERLELNETWLEAAQNAARLFPLRVSESFVSRMNKQDPDDPLLRQVLPLQQEMLEVEGYTADPLFEQSKNPVPGLLHKFKGRVLLTVTSACAVHCRYCFRRDFPYQANNPGKLEWQQAFDYIAQDQSIHEVILSGGDPLSLDDDYLAWFLQQLSAITHVNIIRIHTRFPIMIPERVTPEFIQALTSTRLKPVMVIHCNHPQEIDDAVHAAMQRASRHMTLLNQSVLLQGVNDDAQTLIQLSEKLFAADVLPYYIHQLDPVRGAMHFNVEDLRAKMLHQEMTARLPGYLVPKLVREVPGLAAKQVLV
ncbi:MAG TPA: EF-P beta-lysylation protein EpmB [Gammaproteobacteria bacterium]|nr:EF-P beta-lysylation protein EpmB [Gammaproteobacteria bacterium]